MVAKLKQATLEMLGEGADAAQKMTRMINPEVGASWTGMILIKNSAQVDSLTIFKPFSNHLQSPSIPAFLKAAKRILNALREAHGGKVEVGGPAEVPNVDRTERFVQPTIVVDPKKDILKTWEDGKVTLIFSWRKWMDGWKTIS